MTRIICALALVFLLYPVRVLAQKPKVVRSYYSKGGIGCNNFLTLSDNGIFFYAGSCRNDVALSKGNWKIKGDKLYLHGWDSSKCYPKVKVDLIRGDTTGKIRISAYDYFGKPFKGLALEFTGFRNYIQYEQADTLGRFYVSRKEIQGFILYFQNKEEVKYYTFEKDTKEAKIYIDFASSTGLNRKAVAHYFGNCTYIIKKDKLYNREGGLLYELRKF